ncbi:MAG: hypothetical protein JJE05_10530 [Actinobacteria bacterium]|nr:hypothetical protein [Actinomycetota bacterium]
MSSARRFGALVLVAGLLVTGCSSNEEPSPADTAVEEQSPGSAESAIRGVFDDYRAALLAGDGAAAHGFLSQASIDFYVEMRDLALTAPRSELEARSLVERLHVLTLRYVLAPQRLESMEPVDVIAYAVESGLIGQGTLQQQELDEVTVDGDEAEATIVSEGSGTEFTYGFVEDPGGWKMDLLGILDVANETFRGLIEDESISETTFIFDTIEVITGQRPTKVLWDPPKR